MHRYDSSQLAHLSRLFCRQPHIEKAGHAERFVLLYIFCEALLRVVINGYQNRPGSTPPASKTHSTIRKNVAANAFQYYGVMISAIDVDKLLDSKLDKRGSKSARELRNGLIHGWNSDDEKEVQDRSAELSALLDRTLQAIKSRTTASP